MPCKLPDGVWVHAYHCRPARSGTPDCQANMHASKQSPDQAHPYIHVTCTHSHVFYPHFPHVHACACVLLLILSPRPNLKVLVLLHKGLGAIDACMHCMSKTGFRCKSSAQSAQSKFVACLLLGPRPRALLFSIVCFKASRAHDAAACASLQTSVHLEVGVACSLQVATEYSGWVRSLAIAGKWLIR